MQYPDEIVLEGDDLQFWKTHSMLIADLAEGEDELTMERDFFDLINPETELVDEDIYPPESSGLYWMMFVDLVQGNKVGTFNSAGLALLNTRKGYTKKRLMRLLDYLGFSKSRQSIEALKSYMRSHQINYVRETVPRGIGVRKAPSATTYKRKVTRYTYNNYNNNNNNLNYNAMKKEANENNNNNNSVVTNNNYYSEDDDLQRILATLPTKFVPHSKTEKERKRRHRKHSYMTKRMRPKDMRKPKKNKRTSKVKASKRDRNNNNNAVYNNNNMNSSFSFDD